MLKGTVILPDFGEVKSSSVFISRVLGKERSDTCFGDQVQVKGNVVITSMKLNSGDQDIVFANELAIVRNNCIHMLAILLQEQLG